MPAQVPIITAFSPQSGAAGTRVNITGLNFDPVPGNNVVYFGGVQAMATAASMTNLVVHVPPGATYAPITETVHGLTACADADFLPTFSGAGLLTRNSFSTRLEFPAPPYPDLVVIADLDGDGKPDLVVHCGNNTVSIFQNISVGGSLTPASFAPRIDLPIGGSQSTAGGLALADLNGDGKLDIVTSSYVDRKVSIFQNFCTRGTITSSSFGKRVDIPVSGGPVTLAVRDLDGDGCPDIVTGSEYVNTVSLLRNLGESGMITSKSFAAQVDFPVVNNSRWVAIADLDGDGKPDVATVDYNDGSGVLSVLRNISTPGSISSDSFAPRVDFTGLPNGSDVKTCDLDGDGKLDVVVANGAHGQAVSVYRNLSTPGNLAFESRVDFGLGGWGNGVALGDLDGDGKPDVAAVTQIASQLSLFRNTSTPGVLTGSSLAARLDFPSGPNSYGAAIGDLDGDGRPDIVLANNYGSTIFIYQNLVPQTTPPVVDAQMAAQVNGAVVSASHPALSISGTRSNLQLTWPVTAGTYEVQTADNLLGPWKTLVLPLVTNGANLMATVTATNQQQFYRLQRQ
ncbi:MAG TPA: FG-GAP-like repeat-containing protein [Verrucomicrobiae bacterium]|nr:FG-GAP-like repeat-containing protein [Verrucomicrobiae bacterium]